MIVDTHAHFVPSAVLQPGWGHPHAPAVHFADGHQVAVELDGRRVDAIVDELSRPEQILSELAAGGVQGAWLTPWVALLPDGRQTLVEEEDLCRRHNQAMAEEIASHRPRLLGLAALPLSDPHRAAVVLSEAGDLGLIGAEITPSFAGTFLGDDRWTPLWEAAADLGSVLFVHPATRGLGMDALHESYLWNAVGNPLETAIAGAQMVVSGVFERFPGLKLVLAHGGGALPSLVGRLDRAYDVRPETKARLTRPPSWSIRQMYYDTVTHDDRLLAQLVELVGPDHVLLGSDRPFDMGGADPVGSVRAIGLSDSDTERILAGNAAGLAAGAGRGLGAVGPAESSDL